MAYEVTATRRRPQRFEDLAGQEFVAETLKNSIKSSQIAHAYLFTGPRGCGKTSTARILAKALNCQSTEGPNPEPCGQCESCKAITNSSSLDVYEIDGASNTSINDVRQIKDEVMFPPTSARYKIYIIDEVHMLSNAAFNALLKTIEEPPAHVIFIFATTELQKVPTTIKSRCQQYNFRLVSYEKIRELLSDACREMNIQADDEALYWIAKESGGSVRDSYTLFDQVAAFSDGHITYEKLRDKLGLLGIERLNALFEKTCNSDSEGTLQELDEFLQSGISIEQIIANSAEYIRSILFIKNGIKKESLLGQSPERFSKTVIETWSTQQTERALSIFLNLHRDIRYSLSPRYELELAFSKMCWLKEYVSPSEVKAAIEKARVLLEQGNPAATGNATQQGNVFSNGNGSSLGNSNYFAAQKTAPSGSYSSGGSFTPNGNNFQGSSSQPGTGQASGGVQNTQNSPTQGYSNGTSVSGYQNETNSTPPKTMPHFALFDRIKADDSGDDSSFHNGGALPPKTTEAATTNFTENDEEYASYAPDDSGYPEDSEYTEDSDNTAEESSSSEDYMESGVPDNSEKIWNESPVFDESSAGLGNSASGNGETAYSSQSENSDLELHESGQIFRAVNGFSISAGKIYGALVAELSVSNAMLASTIMKTGKWFVEGNTISTTINTEYLKNYIEQNEGEIRPILNGICHQQVDFKIQFQQIVVEKKPEEYPLQVRMLCTAFKGQVVGGKV